MTTELSGRQAELRALIQGFLVKRLASKLEKLKPDDPKCAQLQQEFAYTVWIEDAAKRVNQIQAVTHSLKPVHPDAKGSSLFCAPSGLAALPHAGSHCLGEDYAMDVVGNAAALDVNKFLRLTHQGKSLLELAIAGDADLIAALDADPNRARKWIEAFAGLVSVRGKVASHTHAKQLYWLAEGDPHDEASFHLLSPLYATSLAHAVYQTIQADRFSEEAKAAREARREGQYSAQPVREYPQLAVQKLGGTKPQNISQLNSERRGDNYLLASVPPIWQTQEVRPLLNVEDLFNVFGARPETRRAVRHLQDLLKADPRPTVETRQRRDAAVADVIDVFCQFTAAIRELEPGWSQQPECRLGLAQKRWLDPLGAASAPADTTANQDTQSGIAAAFANWLNARLWDLLPVGDSEFQHWRKLILEEIKAEDWEVLHEQ